MRDLRGTVSVLTLVKAPCQACAAQVVRNATLAAQTPGLVAAVVGADGASPNLSNLAAERGATLGRLVSPRDALEPVAGGPRGLPTTILVDRSGRAARVLAGPVDIETIRVTVRTLLAEPLPALAGPLTPLRLARLSQPSVPRTQIPSALLNRGLMSDVCPVDPDHVYLLATAATGDARLYIARTHGNGLVIHVAGRDGTGSSLAGCGPGAAKAIATQLNRDGLLGAGLSATKPKGGPDVIRSFAFVLADGYTEAVVGGTRYPINGNGFVLSGRFADRTTVVFRGPAGLIRRTLAVGPSRAG